MVNKPKNQGTALETAIVKAARRAGFPSTRMPLQGIKGEPDVEIGTYSPYEAPVPVVWWKRLVKGEGKRRVPDGVKEVVVIEADDFLRLLEEGGHWCEGDCGFSPRRILVQAKATERLNVTRVLGELQSAVQQLVS